nr:hypothetical protein CFP56_04393 [Quercus suber]
MVSPGDSLVLIAALVERSNDCDTLQGVSDDTVVKNLLVDQTGTVDASRQSPNALPQVRVQAWLSRRSGRIEERHERVVSWAPSGSRKQLWGGGFAMRDVTPREACHRPNRVTTVTVTTSQGPNRTSAVDNPRGQCWVGVERIESSMAQSRPQPIGTILPSLFPLAKLLMSASEATT